MTTDAIGMTARYPQMRAFLGQARSGAIAQVPPRLVSGGIRIEVEGLSKSFGDVGAVDALSFSAEPGEVTGFL